MKRLSLLIALLALTFVSSSAFAQFTQPQMAAEWQRAKTYTKAYLDAMPEDGYSFKPTPEIRSFAQQMLHLAGADYYYISTITGKPNPVDEETIEKKGQQTKAAVTKIVTDSYDYVISALQALTPAQMQENVTMFGYTLTKSEVFGKAFEHQTHHRGQCVIYLRLKGVTPPGEMLFN